MDGRDRRRGREGGGERVRDIDGREKLGGGEGRVTESEGGRQREGGNVIQ